MKTSNVILCQNIKLDNTYKNVLDYNEEEMKELINDNKVVEGNNYTFIREEKNVIQVGFSYATICNCNYLAFQNKDYNNRWFYGFIKDIQYVGEKCCNVVYDIDVWSTFYNSLNLVNCFVEREHVNDDTIGANTIDEGLSTGELMQINHNTMIEDYGDNWVIVVDTSYVPELTGGGSVLPASQYSGAQINTGIVTSTQYVIFAPLSMQDIDVGACIVNLNRFIGQVNRDGHIGDIKNIFFAPEVSLRDTELDAMSRRKWK